MKKHIQIKDSYKVWSTGEMVRLIYLADPYYGCPDYYKFNTALVAIEWWLHNIAYWLTLPFIFIPWVKKLNERAKHVDLEIEYPNSCYNCKYGEWVPEDEGWQCHDADEDEGCCHWEQKEEDV